MELDRAEDLARQRLAEAQRDADRIRRDAQLEAERQQALAREAEAARIATEREQLRLQAERDVQAKAEAERRQAEEQAKRQEQAAETATMLATLPTRTELDVRLMAPLNSGRVKAEDRFEAATVEDVLVKGRVVIPAGSVMRGIVASVEPATRTNRTAKMVLTFDQLTINNASYPIRGTVTRLLEGPGLKGETKRIAAGGAVGAIIGGILGGAKGAIAGLGIGAGGTIAATEGKEIDLADGSILRVRLERVQTR